MQQGADTACLYLRLHTQIVQTVLFTAIRISISISTSCDRTGSMPARSIPVQLHTTRLVAIPWRGTRMAMTNDMESA